MVDLEMGTDRARITFSLAAKSAFEKGRDKISPEELLEGLFGSFDINSGVGFAAIRETGVDIDELKASLGYSPSNFTFIWWISTSFRISN